MKDIFRLYCYDIKENKNIFKILTLLTVIYIVINFSLNFYMILNFNPSYIKEVLKDFSQQNNIAPYISNIIINKNISYYSFDDFIYSQSLLVVGTIYIYSIFASIFIVVDDFSRKNKSMFVYANLPIATYKYKISKILTGFSIYLFTMIIMQISYIMLNFLYKLFLNEYYDASLSNMISIGLPLNFDSFGANMHFIFITILASVIFLQSFVSIFYNGRENGNYLKKVMCFIAVLLYMFLILLIIVAFYLDDYKVMYSIFNFDIFTVLNFLIITLGLLTFTLDCKLTNRRIRGGL
ncbi:hypothetical protein [Peptostreptococcus equinus]|uniref:ABC-2 family transporter protein n=1 Tax=Peptostreptococcus equinus TaxID=3003601 RepID=A0ABY7JQY0_9FIRM|nr:hypothetical protein [Peptostreptococcus sp. CBA3647]WAW15774.1 hypothetical protein O0R46_04800 [Peptostreptococcus sp. CBA3647]